MIKYLFLYIALLGCAKENPSPAPKLTISNANPIQFWLNGEETFNQKEECSITPICFCQKFECDDEIRIQFRDTTGKTFELVVYNSDSIELARVDFEEISSGVYEVSFIPNGLLSPSICETIKLTISQRILGSWAVKTTPANSWNSVVYGNGLFVAVAFDGTGNRVMTSPDGITWTSRTSAADNAWQNVTYANGLFVAVSADGANRVMTSPDGITWTSRSAAAPNQWNEVAYGNGLFVAVAASGVGNRVMTSPDGITWTSRTSAADNGWQAVVFGNGLFVTVANTGSGNRVMTSNDGITWTIRASASDKNWLDVAYGNGLFAAISYGGDQVMTSHDGITWTSISVTARLWTSITYGNGLFVVLNFGDVFGLVSNDGITWNSINITTANQWNGVTYANGLFVGVGVGAASTTRAILSTLTSSDMATSDCIELADDQEDCTVLIEYSNSSDFAGLVYHSSPTTTFQIRLSSVFFEESFPDEYEALDLSDSEMVQLRSEVKHKKLLELDYMPFYMYKKLQLILAHDSITIDSLPWIKLDPLNIVQARRTFPLRRASILLTEKDFVERNIL